MRRGFPAAMLAALVLGVSAAGCGSASTAAPDPVSAPPDAIVIDILGINGARSFSPNPMTVAPGRTVVWHNLDFDTHRIVLDGGALDTGDISPGHYSGPMVLGASGGYHCAIHPVMVGTIRGN